jgi:hypothetical protein
LDKKVFVVGFRRFRRRSCTDLRILRHHRRSATTAPAFHRLAAARVVRDLNLDPVSFRPSASPSMNHANNSPS